MHAASLHAQFGMHAHILHACCYLLYACTIVTCMWHTCTIIACMWHTCVFFCILCMHKMTCMKHAVACKCIGKHACACSEHACTCLAHACTCMFQCYYFRKGPLKKVERPFFLFHNWIISSSPIPSFTPYIIECRPTCIHCTCWTVTEEGCCKVLRMCPIPHIAVWGIFFVIWKGYPNKMLTRPPKKLFGCPPQLFWSRCGRAGGFFFSNEKNKFVSDFCKPSKFFKKQIN